MSEQKSENKSVSPSDNNTSPRYSAEQATQILATIFGNPDEDAYSSDNEYNNCETENKKCSGCVNDCCELHDEQNNNCENNADEFERSELQELEKQCNQENSSPVQSSRVSRQTKSITLDEEFYRNSLHIITNILKWTITGHAMDNFSGTLDEKVRVVSYLNELVNFANDKLGSFVNLLSKSKLFKMATHSDADEN